MNPPVTNAPRNRVAVLSLALVAFAVAPVCVAADTGEARAQTTKQALGLARPIGSDDAPTLPGRPDASRAAEHAAFEHLQSRIDVLAAKPVANCLDAFQAQQAQAWFNFSRYGLQTGVDAAPQRRSLANATAIVAALEARGPAPAIAEELPGARHLRDVLWRGVAAATEDGRMCAAPKMTAFCEVQLSWAGYEAGNGGWRHVEPYIRIAEDYCAQAFAAHAPLPPPERLPIELPPTDIPASQLTAVERFDLSASVLFPHDRAARKDLRPAGRVELKALAVHIRELLDVASITVIGHADVTGTPVYNVALSKRRAATVAAELAADGVAAEKITAVGVGSTEPVVACSAALRHSHHSRYLTCLEPNRRVTVELAGTVAHDRAPTPP